MKQEEINNIEDLLELSAGLLHSDKSIKLDTSDMTIMYSIARQTFKGTALTDRQHALMSEKLVAYRAQFIEAGVDFDKSINELRQPIRQIDRSKYIKICKPGDAIPLKQMDHNIEWIKIRFPFSKKLIVLLEEVKAGTRQDHHYHERGSHEHYFALNDRTISLIVPRFINKEFDIDQELIDQYNKFKSVSLFDFHPYYDGELHNINDSLR